MYLEPYIYDVKSTVMFSIHVQEQKLRVQLPVGIFLCINLPLYSGYIVLQRNSADSPLKNRKIRAKNNNDDINNYKYKYKNICHYNSCRIHVNKSKIFYQNNY